MTDVEEAYNLGVARATEAVRVAAKAISPNHALNSDALLAIADIIDVLKIPRVAEATP